MEASRGKPHERKLVYAAPCTAPEEDLVCPTSSISPDMTV